MKALRNAIYAKLAGSTLDTLINGQLYHVKAPTGTRYPYVVFSRVVGSMEKTFTVDYDNPLIQFSVFSANSSSSNEVYDIAEAVKSLYHKCTLTVTGSTFIYMEFQNDAGPTEDDTISQDGADGGMACHLDFEIMTL